MNMPASPFGLRGQAKRDTAFALLGAFRDVTTCCYPKARSPLRSASALQIILLVGVLSVRTSQADNTNSPSLAALAELTKPAKGIPFKEVILATTRHRVLHFDTNNPAHVALHQKLTAAAAAAAKARADGLYSARANEAGNHMEPFVKAALGEAGLNARTPVTSAGSAQTVGYPDVEISGDPPCYLELKTYNAATVNTSQRSFYYSPSANPKVTRDALHLLLAFELEKGERDGKTVFVPTHWKLISLQDLEVDLKFEFNQSNRGLYGKQAKDDLLSEGKTQ